MLYDRTKFSRDGRGTIITRKESNNRRPCGINRAFGRLSLRHHTNPPQADPCIRSPGVPIDQFESQIAAGKGRNVHVSVRKTVYPGRQHDSQLAAGIGVQQPNTERFVPVGIFHRRSSLGVEVELRTPLRQPERRRQCPAHGGFSVFGQRIQGRFVEQGRHRSDRERISLDLPPGQRIGSRQIEQRHRGQPAGGRKPRRTGQRAETVGRITGNGHQSQRGNIVQRFQVDPRQFADTFQIELDHREDTRTGDRCRAAAPPYRLRKSRSPALGPIGLNRRKQRQRRSRQRTVLLRRRELSHGRRRARPIQIARKTQRPRHLAPFRIAHGDTRHAGEHIGIIEQRHEQEIKFFTMQTVARNPDKRSSVAARQSREAVRRNPER